jgi:hypothetical protein
MVAVGLEAHSNMTLLQFLRTEVGGSRITFGSRTEIGMQETTQRIA